MIFLRIFIFIASIFLSVLHGVDIAITIDDFPMAEGALFSTKERTDKFIDACQKHACKAAFFCIGKNCKENDGNTNLAIINKNGHFLANHSMTHTHFSEQSLDVLESEIKETEKILSSYENMRKWYRYPFLDYGNREPLGGTKEKTAKSLELLKRLNYVEGFVSINTFDWHIDDRLKAAINEGKTVNYDALKKLYLSLIKEWCNFFINYFQNEFQGQITHALLFHANDLNALYLKDILQLLKESKWNIVSPEKAFKNSEWRTVWHKKISDGTLFMYPAPLSLNCQEIDKLLDQHKVFSN